MTELGLVVNAEGLRTLASDVKIQLRHSIMSLPLPAEKVSMIPIPQKRPIYTSKNAHKRPSAKIHRFRNAHPEKELSTSKLFPGLFFNDKRAQLR